jgi:hypothetical protein
MKKQMIWYVVGAAILVALGWLVFAPVEVKEVASKGEKTKVEKAQKKVEKAKRKMEKKVKREKSAAEKPKMIVEENDDEYTPEERKIADAIQAALDDDDLKAMQASIEAAANSTNVLLRQAAVDALAWFGEKALPELTMFMADKDDDVRGAACDAWTMAVSTIENTEVRGAAVQAAMSVVYDRDRLDSMVMEINDMSNVQQLQILTQLIEGDNKIAAEAAKEHYEFVTGEAYESVEAAEKWLKENPDEESEEGEEDAGE